MYVVPKMVDVKPSGIYVKKESGDVDVIVMNSFSTVQQDS